MSESAAVLEEMEQAQKEVDELLSETKRHAEQENKVELAQRFDEMREEFACRTEIAVLQSQIKLIENLGKEVSCLSGDVVRHFTSKLLLVREKSEARKRKLQVLRPPSLQDLQADIMWMAEQGTLEHLPVIHQVKSRVSELPREVEDLLNISEHRIVERFFDPRNELQTFYRLYPMELARLIGMVDWNGEPQKLQATTHTVENLERIKTLLEDMFKQEEAVRWLHTPKRIFGDKTPLNVIADGGSDKILEVLTALEEGIHV
jgi:hypothetical protein